MNFPNPTNNNEMCNFDMSWLTNHHHQQQQQLSAKDMDDSTRARIEYLSSMIQSIYKGIESGATNHAKGLQLVQQLELETGINLSLNGSSQVSSRHLVSPSASKATSTTASAMTSQQTLPHNHDAELRLDPLEDWQAETLVAMLSKPDEVNNRPQKNVKKAEDLSTLFQIIGKEIDSGAPNCTDLVLNGIIRVPGIIREEGSRVSSRPIVSAPSSVPASTAASATSSPLTLLPRYNNDAELQQDLLRMGAKSLLESPMIQTPPITPKLGATPAPLRNLQIETLHEMLSKPDEVNNPPQKKVNSDALLDLSTLFQIIGKGIDSGAPNCTYEQAVQLLKRLQLYDLVLNGIIRVPGISREEGSRVSSGRLVSAPSSVPAPTAASATSSPLTLPRYKDDAELQQDLLMMGVKSLLGSPMIQTPPITPKLAATPAPLHNWQIETVNGMLSQPDEVNPQQKKKKVDAALLQQQFEVHKTTEMTRQVTPDQRKKVAVSVDRHKFVSNVQQRQVAQQAPAKLPLKKRPVDTAAAASSIQNSLRELDEQQRKEKKKKLFQQRVFSPAKLPPKKKKASPKKKTATLWARPDKVCRDESCSSLKQAGYDGYCIRHCKLFNNAKWAENKEKKAERKAAAEKKAAE